MFYLVFTWLTFAASIAFGGWAGMNPNGVASIPACISGIAGVVLLSQYIEHSAMRWMARVGAMSMTIYVMHLLAGAGTRIVVQHLHVPLGPWAYLFLCTSAGVVLPMLAHSVLDRCDLLAALGLGPSRRHKILAERRDGPLAAAIRSAFVVYEVLTTCLSLRPARLTDRPSHGGKQAITVFPQARTVTLSQGLSGSRERRAKLHVLRPVVMIVLAYLECAWWHIYNGHSAAYGEVAAYYSAESFRILVIDVSML